MSSNPFSNDSLVPNWTEATRILKDQEGHEFRGNQYTTGVGGGGGSAPAPRQSDPNRNVAPERNNGSYGLPTSGSDSHLSAKSASDLAVSESASGKSRDVVGTQHGAAADYHRQAAEETDDETLKELHLKAADAHDRASSHHAEGDTETSPTKSMKASTQRAASATKAVNDHIASKKKSDAATQELIETYSIKVDGKNNASVKGLDFVVEGTPLERMREDDSKLADALSARLGKLGSKFGATVKVERLHGPQGHPTISVDGPRDKVVAFIRQYDEGTI